jgi:DNA-binding NtrC family response regulator
VLDIRIPPLRERPEDILLLFNMFLERFSAEQHRSTPPVPRGTERKIMAHGWPGNVRELQNYAEKYAILYPEEAALGADITPWTPHAALTAEHAHTPAYGTAAAPVSRDLLHGTLEDITRAAVAAVLHEENGNLSSAARRLGISRNTLRRRLG